MKIETFIVALLPSYASALMFPSEPGVRGVKGASEEEENMQDLFTRFKKGSQGTAKGSKPDRNSEAVSKYESSQSNEANFEGKAKGFNKVGNNRSRMSIKGTAMSRKQDRKTVKGMKSSFGPSRTNQPGRIRNPKSRKGQKRGVFTGTKENNKEITTHLNEKFESNQGRSKHPIIESQQGRPNYPTREGSSKPRSEKCNTNESQNRSQTPAAPSTSFRRNKPSSESFRPTLYRKEGFISPPIDPTSTRTNWPTSEDTSIKARSQGNSNYPGTKSPTRPQKQNIPENTSVYPTKTPVVAPTTLETNEPTSPETYSPTLSETKRPSLSPSTNPTSKCTILPTSGDTTMPYSATASQQGRPNHPTTKNPTQPRAENISKNASPYPIQIPVAAPATVQTYKPTFHDTYSPTLPKTRTIPPTLDPNLISTNRPTAEDTFVPTPGDTGKPSEGSVDTFFDQPTPSPTMSPSGKSSVAETYEPSGAPVESPSVSPSSTPTANFLQACRCDELGNCLFQALPTNTNLKICIFVEEEEKGVELIDIETMFLFQGGLEQSVLKPGDASSTEKQKICRNNICAVETMVSSGFFKDSKGSAMLTAEGQAFILVRNGGDDVKPDYRSLRSSVPRRVHQQKGQDIAKNVIQMRFATIVELGTSSVAVGGGGQSKPEVGAGKGTESSLPIVAWVIPLLIVALILGIGLGLCLRRRRPARQH